MTTPYEQIKAWIAVSKMRKNSDGRLLRAFEVAVETLQKNAKPALGGKQQQSDAQFALQSITQLIQP